MRWVEGLIVFVERVTWHIWPFANIGLTGPRIGACAPLATRAICGSGGRAIPLPMSSASAQMLALMRTSTDNGGSSHQRSASAEPRGPGCTSAIIPSRLKWCGCAWAAMGNFMRRRAQPVGWPIMLRGIRQRPPLMGVIKSTFIVYFP